MARLIKSYKGYKIKETTVRDKKNGALSQYWLFRPNETYYIEWECDSITEAMEFIEGQIQDEEKGIK